MLSMAAIVARYLFITGRVPAPHTLYNQSNCSASMLDTYQCHQRAAQSLAWTPRQRANHIFLVCQEMKNSGWCAPSSPQFWI